MCGEAVGRYGAVQGVVEDGLMLEESMLEGESMLEEFMWEESMLEESMLEEDSPLYKHALDKTRRVERDCMALAL